MGKTPRTVHFDDEQIEQIEAMAEEKDRPFGWIVRWLIDLAFGAMIKDEEGEPSK